MVGPDQINVAMRGERQLGKTMFAHSLVPIQRFWMRAMLRIKCYKFSSVLRIEYGRKSP